MSLTRRTWISVALGVLAFVLYAADLLGLKPPPRILPSVVLAVAAVVVGVTPRRAGQGHPTGAEHATDPAHPSPGVTRATATAPGMPPVARVMTITGFVLLLLLLVPVVPIGLVAPGLGILTIHGIWLVGFIVAWRLRRSNPPVVLAVPFVAAALIAATLWVGTTLLGWQP